jgi:very-short-patch-repair endonuclease
LYVRRDGKIIKLPLGEIKEGDEIAVVNFRFKWTPELDLHLKEEYTTLGRKGFIEKYNLPVTRNAVGHRAWKKFKLRVPIERLYSMLPKKRSLSGIKLLKKNRNCKEDLSEAQLKECVDLFENKKVPIRKLVKKYDSTIPLITKQLQKAGIDTNRKNPNQKKWTEQELADFREDIKTKTRKELEEKYGRSYLFSLKKKAKRMGIFWDRDFGRFRSEANKAPELVEKQRLMGRKRLLLRPKKFWYQFIYRRGHLTDIERKMKTILDANDIQYKQFVSIKCKNYRLFFPDFLIDDHIFIECDGEYWHNDEEDKIKDKILEENGYLVWRFKGKQILKEPQEVAKCILKKLSELKE